MVLPSENLMALTRLGEQPVGLRAADFEFSWLRDQDSNLEPTG